MSLSHTERLCIWKTKTKQNQRYGAGAMSASLQRTWVQLLASISDWGVMWLPHACFSLVLDVWVCVFRVSAVITTSCLGSECGPSFTESDMTKSYFMLFYLTKQKQLRYLAWLESVTKVNLELVTPDCNCSEKQHMGSSHYVQTGRTKKREVIWLYCHDVVYVLMDKAVFATLLAE